VEAETEEEVLERVTEPVSEKIEEEDDLSGDNTLLVVVEAGGRRGPKASTESGADCA
jgi:hypothetical protein